MTAKYEQEGSGGAFICGLLTGAAFGAVAAILFAPRAGWETRRDLADGVGDLGQAARDRWGDVTEAAASAVDKGRVALEQPRGAVQEAADSAAKSAAGVKGAVKDAANEVASTGASHASSAVPRGDHATIIDG